MTGEFKRGPELDGLTPKIDMGTGDTAPSRSDVQEMYNKSRQNRDCLIQWAWTEAGTGKAYRLTILYPFVRESDWWDYERKDDPTWHLYDDRTLTNPVIWEYKSGDFELAVEIVQMVCSRDSRESAVSQTTASTSQTPVFPDAPIDLKAQLTGNPVLREQQDINQVLRSFVGNQFTGRVDLRTNTDFGFVFFENGLVTHAITNSGVGDSAIREMVTWQIAQSNAAPDELAEARTITKHVEYLIREGEHLLEQQRYLMQMGLCFESTLIRTALPDADTQKWLPAPEYKRVYDYCEAPRLFADLARDLKLGMSFWVPVLVHFLSNKILQIESRPILRSNALSFLGGQRSAIEGKLGCLLSPQTGLYKHHALILFLEREFLIARRLNRPLSLIVFELQSGINIPGKPRWLSAPMVKLVTERVEALKKPLDLFSHFESLDYALLLPNTDMDQALTVAQTILTALTRVPLAETPERITLNAVCGIATYPDNASSLQKLIACAKFSKNMAKRGNGPILAGVSDEGEDDESAGEARLTVAQQAQEALVSNKQFELYELLIRSELVTPDQIAEARQLMVHMNLPMDRVLAMHGHIQSKSVMAASDIHAMIRSGELTIDQGVRAVQLIGRHGLDAHSALKRLGRKKSQTSGPLATLLRDSGLVTPARMEGVLRAAANTGLPVGYVLTSRRLLSRATLHAALTVLDLLNKNVINRETAIHSLLRPANCFDILRDRGVDYEPFALPSPLERLLLNAGILMESDLLTVRETCLSDGIEFDSAIGQFGFANQSCLDAAKQLVMKIVSGEVSENDATEILRAVKAKEVVPDVSTMIAQVDRLDQSQRDKDKRLSSAQHRMLVTYCKERNMTFQDTLELFGWQKVFRAD